MAQTQAKKDLTVREASASERFTALVVNEFTATVGTGIQLNEDKKRLAQHLFVKVNATLNELEAKRQKDGKNSAPIVWENVNMQKLALDAVHRIELGLDALIPNHIHPIPYFNGKLKKYDLDLRIGYVGKDYYRRKIALEAPKDIRYELVYETDHFVALKKNMNREVEGYAYEIQQPFDRGNIIGGFGYIIYDDPTKNKLVLVTEADFLKSQKAAQSDKFWKPHGTEMRYKTLVTRVTDKLSIDPAKVTEALAAVEAAEVDAEIEREANQEIIDIQAEPTGSGHPEDSPMSDEEKEQALRKEKEEYEREQQNQGQQKRGPGF